MTKLCASESVSRLWTYLMDALDQPALDRLYTKQDVRCRSGKRQWATEGLHEPIEPVAVDSPLDRSRGEQTDIGLGPSDPIEEITMVAEAYAPRGSQLDDVIDGPPGALPTELRAHWHSIPEPLRGLVMADALQENPGQASVTVGMSPSEAK